MCVCVCVCSKVPGWLPRNGQAEISRLHFGDGDVLGVPSQKCFGPCMWYCTQSLQTFCRFLSSGVTGFRYLASPSSSLTFFYTDLSFVLLRLRFYSINKDVFQMVTVLRLAPKD